MQVRSLFTYTLIRVSLYRRAPESSATSVDKTKCLTKVRQVSGRLAEEHTEAEVPSSVTLLAMSSSDTRFSLGKTLLREWSENEVLLHQSALFPCRLPAHTTPPPLVPGTTLRPPLRRSPALTSSLYQVTIRGGMIARGGTYYGAESEE